MLIIKLFRVGKKKQPFFKIVVTDRRKPTRAGRFVEELGNYNPLTKEKVLKKERVKYWLSVGAKPSASIYNLLVSEKIIEGKKISLHKKSKKEKEAVIEKPLEKPAEKAAEKLKKEEKTKEETPKPASAEATTGKEEKKEEVSSEASAKEESPKTE